MAAWHRIRGSHTGLPLVCGDDPIQIMTMAFQHLNLLWRETWGRNLTKRECEVAWSSVIEQEFDYLVEGEPVDEDKAETAGQLPFSEIEGGISDEF